MFNIPWYSWLNLLGLLLLWAMMYFDYVALKKPRWAHQFTTAAIVASAVTIVLYWNPGINTLLSPLQYGLIALVLPMAVWQVGLGITELAVAIASHCFASATENSTAKGGSKIAPLYNVDDDEIDLDAGDIQPNCQNEVIGTAISNLFSSNASARSNIESVVALTGVDVDEVKKDADITSHIVHTLMVSVLLVPPMVMSLRLV